MDSSGLRGVMVCSALACLAVAPGTQFTELKDHYRNRDYGFTITIPAGLAGHASGPPAPNHGLEIILPPASDGILVNAEYDASLKVSVDAIADDWAADLQRREPGLTLSSRRLVTLDGLDAVESVLDGQSRGRVGHVRQLVAWRPQAGGVAIVYDLALEQRVGSKAADDTFAEIVDSFRMTDIPRGTSPDASRLLQQQIAVVACWLAKPWAASVLREVNVRIGDTVEAKFGEGHIAGIAGDAMSDRDERQALLLAPDRKHGYLVMGFQESDGRTTVSSASTYTLSRGGRHWSAGEGNGGIATYRAMGLYADKLDKQPAIALPLRPAPSQRCTTNGQ